MSSKVKSRTQQETAANPTSAGALSDPLAVQQLSDSLTDPLMDTPMFYGGTPEVASAGASGAPGDPSSEGSGPVMFKGGMNAQQVHATAAGGLKGSGGSLPHMDKIQASFGGHDVSGVSAHTGGAASSANKAMGSQAYASGESVAFKGTPDLHTTAHEAAHVVQQRSGVNLAGGVGKAGDSYERHADAVADNVVQGRSAAPLLNQFGGGGGSAVQQSLQTQMSDGAVQFGLMDWARSAYDTITGKPQSQQDFEAAERFVQNESKYEKKPYVPSTGRGGFDVEYWPLGGDGWEKIIMRAAIEFAEPVSFNGNKAVPYDGSKGCKAIADRINDNNATAPDREAAVAAYKWTDKSGWTKKIEDQVFQAWSFEHAFRVEKLGWKWVGADPSVDLSVNEGAKSATDHIGIKLFKVPAGEWFGSSAQGSGARTMRLDTNDFNQNPAERTARVRFDGGTATPTGAGTTRLNKFIARSTGDDTHTATANQPVVITAGDSTGGSITLARERANYVKAQLEAGGWSAGRITINAQGQEPPAEGGPMPDPASARAVSLALTDTGQTTVLHEFGHAFGLDDEYVSKDKNGKKIAGGTGGQVGKDTDHAQLARDAGADGSIAEQSANMMSIGNKVKPQHYATFHEALTKATGVKEWKLGTRVSKATEKAAAVPAEESGTTEGMGDFNVPTGDTRMA